MIRPLLLGHRGAGACREIPENTVASFELSLEEGCDGFEFDVRLSGDGVAVVCHDPENHGSMISATCENELHLPTLQQVLPSFAERAFLDIELKVTGLEVETLALLERYPPKQGFLVSSFLPEVVTKMRDMNPEIPLGFICRNRNLLPMWRELPVEWVILEVGLTGQRLIAEIHQARRKVIVWTVNDADDAQRLASFGVDALISDQPEAMVKRLRPPLALGRHAGE